MVRFSHDGKYLFMVDTFVAVFQVHAADGSLEFEPPSAPAGASSRGFVTMAAWSHQSDRLYYRDAAGVHTWDAPSTQRMMAAGLNWFSPSISPDDRFVAYVVSLGYAVGNQPHMEVRDLGSGTVTVIPGVRGAPFFISDSMLLEAEYAPTAQQGPDPLYGPTGKNFVFDLRSKVETSVSAVINTIDSWPR